MFFKVLPKGIAPPKGTPNRVFLIRDNWNDYRRWWTMLTLTVVDGDRVYRTIGSVKIGCFGMDEGEVDLKDDFEDIGDSYFSLGQNENYYESLFQLEASLRDRIFLGLRDVAFDLKRFERAGQEAVMRRSLLRGISAERVRTRFHRLAHGNVALTRFKFQYTFPEADGESPTLLFDVRPESTPPTNIHIIIGGNGVGKSRCLQSIALSILSGARAPETLGTVRSTPTDLESSADASSFGNVAVVTFSAFDVFEPLARSPSEDRALRYAYIGLKGGKPLALSRAIEAVLTPVEPQQDTRPKNIGELEKDFVESVLQCRIGVRRGRWKRALETLGEADLLFKASDTANLVEIDDEKELRTRAAERFRILSSGHKIVLLTVTRLVETVEENTLVLLDEPEAHLHPPLLSAFVRCLSELLVDRNGVAIIATHSPVVLQEVPSDCVSILRRSGSIVQAYKPSIETFGENVGILTREVFRLEVTRSGFHGMLHRQVAESDRTYEEIIEGFGNQLGLEARAILRALVANRDASLVGQREAEDMQTLPRPTQDASDVYLTCVGGYSHSVSQKLKDRLLAIADLVESAGASYDDAGRSASFHLLPTMSGLQGPGKARVSHVEMSRLYDLKFVRPPGRKFYDEIMMLARGGTCPICGHRDISTLDHYLPKSKYPALAVLPLNLVPACRECNHGKREDSPTSAETQTLHPYYDDVTQERWLYANVRETRPPSLAFEARPPADWDPVRKARVAHHLDAFGLGILYASQSASELANIRGSLLSVAHRAGGVREFLDDAAASRESHCRNSWQTATYRALSLSDWFCNEGFKLE